MCLSQTGKYCPSGMTFIPNIRGPQIFRKSRNHLKILGTRRVARITSPTEDPLKCYEISQHVQRRHGDTYALAHGYDEPTSLFFLIKHTKSKEL